MIRLRALELFAELRSALEDFDAWWSGRVIECVVFPIALYPHGEVPDQIAVERVSEAAAIVLARQAFARFDRLDAQHPVTVVRLPGYILLSEDPGEQVAAVNRCKQALEQWIKRHVPSASSRTKLCRRLFPGAVMHQVYRQVPYAGAEIARISFLWSPTTSASTHLSAQEATTLIHDAMQTSGADSTVHLAIALERVAALGSSPSVQLLRRTPVAPHPRVALFEAFQGRAAKTYHANLPLLLAPGSGPRTIRDLGSFDASRRQLPRGRPQRSLTPVCLPLHLYEFRKPR